MEQTDKKIINEMVNTLVKIKETAKNYIDDKEDKKKIHDIALMLEKTKENEKKNYIIGKEVKKEIMEKFEKEDGEEFIKEIKNIEKDLGVEMTDEIILRYLKAIEKSADKILIIATKNDDEENENEEL